MKNLTLAEFKSFITETVFDQNANNNGFYKADLGDLQTFYSDASETFDETLVGIRFIRLDEQTIVFRCEYTDVIGIWHIKEDMDDPISFDDFIFDAVLGL